MNEHDESQKKNEPKVDVAHEYEAPRVVEDLLLEIESLACGKRNGVACNRAGGIRT
jgi:hypothetical protein